MAPRPPVAEPDAPLLRRTRWRLALWSGGATLVTLLILGLLLYGVLTRILAADSERRLDARVAEVQAAVQRASRGDIIRFLQREDGIIGRRLAGGPAAGTTTIVVQPGGDAFGRVPAELVGEVPVVGGFEAARSGQSDVRSVTLADTPFRVRSEPIAIAGRTWVLQVLDDRSAERRVLGTVLVVLGLGGFVVLLAATAVGYLYAGRALVPIRTSLRRQREFAADASHELRTPITVIRANADFARRSLKRPSAEVAAAIDDISAEGERLTRLVDELLLLARADSGVVELRSEQLDLTDLAGDALRALGRLAGDRDVRLELVGEPVIVRGDPDRLRQLITIVVDNAVRHSPAGAAVRVRVARDGRAAVLSVADQGPGIGAADLPRLFDRFFRGADAPAGGSGLGLSIAQWIAERHDGRLVAANLEDGALFTLTLPATG